MASLNNQMESSIKREITKLYKTSFGKGPENTEVIIYEKFVILKFIDALSQIEKSLMNTENGKNIVEKIRDELILSQTSVYVPTIEKIINEKIYKVNYIMEEKNNILYVFLLFENVIVKN